MYSLLLIIIYISFISLGIGDSLLGSAWPVMHGQLDVPVAYADIVSMTIAAGTITSSLLSDRFTKRLGTRLVVVLSVCLSCAALLGFSVSGSFLLVWLWAVPYGIGGGALDATINNYVAVNYKSRHMNWLHCFWGVGAMTGPYIMGFYLTRGFQWTAGYRAAAMIQLALIVILIASFPLWKGQKRDSGTGEKAAAIKPFSELLKIKGVKHVLLAFFAYCAVEATAGLWASTYLVSQRGINPETAAGFASLFFIGVTAGRFLSGFISGKLGNDGMVKLGTGIIFAGIMLVWLPASADMVSLAGLIVIGLGCAPVFPAIIHSTPGRFGHENSQALVGLQMASAYMGSALVPPLFGFVAGVVGMGFYPVFLLVFAILLLFMMISVNM